MEFGLHWVLRFRLIEDDYGLQSINGELTGICLKPRIPSLSTYISDHVYIFLSSFMFALYTYKIKNTCSEILPYVNGSFV